MKDKVILWGKLMEYKETWENLMECDEIWWNMWIADCGIIIEYEEINKYDENKKIR